MISTIRGESNCFSRCGPFDDAQGAWTERREPGLFWGQLAPRRSRMLSFLFWTGLGGTFLGAGSSFAF